MMGKRPCHMIVLSSSDEEEDGNNNEHLSKIAVCDSKSVGYTAHKKLKNDRGCSSTSILLQKVSLLGAEDWATFLPETFSDNLTLEQSDAVPKNQNQRPRLAQRAETDLWAEKYRPRALTELAVHRKKVAEVKAWLEWQLNGSMEHFGSRVLLLTGPSGVGKTVTVHVLADLLGIELCEWQTPTPTLWREYVHHVNSGISYVSKLDEFETFIETIRKYPVLPMSSSNAVRLEKTMVILVDDLPIPNSAEACQRLCQCLHTLASSSHFPIIVLITEFAEGGDREGQSRMIREFQLALEQGGATKIVFNPLTAKSILKALTKIWTAECCSVPLEWLSYISESSGGDIRQAVASLQFCCLGQDSNTWDLGGSEYSGPSKAKSRKVSGKKVASSSQSSFTCIEYADKSMLTTSMARDGVLSLFHALGKFLHNKRQTDQASDSEQAFLVLQEKFVRYPLKMEVPEIVLSQAHAEAGTFLAFLHENVLDFIGDEAIDDAWIAASYFSDSDFLLGASGCHRPTGRQALCDSNDFDSQYIAEAVAGSIATRGVLFANSHPAPPRWHSIRGPRLWQVERVYHHKRIEIFSEQRANGGLLRSHKLSVLATEYKPVLQWLATSDHHGSLEPFRGCKQQWEAEELETSELNSVELEDFLRFSDDNILSTSNSDIDHTYFNNFVNEIPGEMDEDEIEDC